MGPFVVILAFAWASAVVSPTPTPPGDVLRAVHALLEAERLDEAEAMVRAQLAAAPSAEAHFLLARILFRRVQIAAMGEGAGGARSEATRQGARAALDEYAKGARLQELGPFDLKIAGLAQLLLEDYASADRLLTWSVEGDPKDPQAWYYLGRTRYHENRFADAATAFERCLAVEPSHARARDNLGLAYAGLGRVEEAAAAYRDAIAAQGETSTEPGPHLNLGSLLLEQDRPREAIAHLHRAVEIAPQLAAARERLGKAYLQIDDLVRAIGELEAAVQLAPESAPLRFLLGQAYRRQGRLDEAKAQLERAEALHDGERR